MNVREYMEREELTVEDLAERLGVQVATVKRQRNKGPIPESWVERLGLDSTSGEGRDWEEVPEAPPDAPRRPLTPPPVMDVSTVAGYIEGAYKLGAHATRDADPLLAEAIEAYAPAAGEAWAKWIESEPKVKALLERLMVGTPLGEVIAVHVGIGFSYFLARSAAARVRRERAEANGDDGGAHAPAEDFLGEPAE